LVYEAAKLYQNGIGRRGQGQRALPAQLELDPEHVEAATPLADIYYREGEWAALVPSRDAGAQGGSSRSRELNTCIPLAKAAEQMGDEEKALKYYRAAYELDATHLPPPGGSGNLLYRRQQWDEAFSLSDHPGPHRESQSEAQIVEIFHRIGHSRCRS